MEYSQLPLQAMREYDAAAAEPSDMEREPSASSGAQHRRWGVRRFPAAPAAAAAAVTLLGSSAWLFSRTRPPSLRSTLGRQPALVSEEEEGEPEAICGILWDQCGGEGFEGTRCCETGLVCVKHPVHNFPSYEQCRPEGDTGRVPLATESDGDCAKLWDQCGGEGYNGPTCCQDGLVCSDHPLEKLPSYRQCKEQEDASGILLGRVCAKLWDQCGGEEYNGPACCEAGSHCVDHPLEDLPTYRQCREQGDHGTSAVERKCAKLWDQCGGQGYGGPTCCEAGAVCVRHPLTNFSSYRQCRKEGDGDSEAHCAKLWDQCGGEKYDGPTCCEDDNLCIEKPLDDLPSYRQCRPPPPPKCEDVVEGSLCHKKLTWDMNVGIHTHPEWYHGLTPHSGLKEFQELEFALNRNESGCNAPCAPGTCYFVFRFEGCDTINEWTCDLPDNSMSYKCCCEYFHSRVNKTRPKDPSPALANAMRAFHVKHPTLFCTAMMMPYGYETELLRAQYSHGKVGLFSCDKFKVYSNRSIVLSPEGESPNVTTGVIDGPMAGVLGGKFHTVLNTQVFLRFWKKVIANEDAWACDWIVKLDPDTMFVPVRLKALLLTKEGPLGKEHPKHGLWLNNCGVGLHGPIEVLSRGALETFRFGHLKCEEGKPAKHGQEDWFLRDCFHELGIQKVDAYNLLFEGTMACQERPSSWHPYRPPCFAPQVAFHPFKAVASWMHCHQETANHPYALPTSPYGERPKAENERHS